MWVLLGIQMPVARVVFVRVESVSTDGCYQQCHVYGQVADAARVSVFPDGTYQRYRKYQFTIRLYKLNTRFPCGSGGLTITGE